MGFFPWLAFFVEEPMNKYPSNHSRFDEVDSQNFEKIKKDQKFRKGKSRARLQEKQFRCVNCGALVSADRELAGVNNRNHCPNCLWSKHVDEFKPGDRKADCCARMQPIGLTVKQIHKKYDRQQQGELMLIHRCTGCGKISINRIASDDSTGALIALYRQIGEYSEELLLELAAQKIHPLMAADVTTVFSQLFGWQSILEEFEGSPVYQEENVDAKMTE
jgi:hypothetical protein